MKKLLELTPEKLMALAVAVLVLLAIIIIKNVNVVNLM